MTIAYNIENSQVAPPQKKLGQDDHSWSHSHPKKLMVGGWATPLKNISQLGWLFPIYGKIKHVPNHQPEADMVQFHSWDILCLALAEIFGDFRGNRGSECQNEAKGLSSWSEASLCTSATLW